MVTIATIVEGHGEVEAVPLLLRRIAQQVSPGSNPTVPRPIRVQRNRILQEGQLERAIELAARMTGADGCILLLLDANGDCPAEIAPQILQRATSARPDRNIRVVLAKIEFEAWFLAAVASLIGRHGIAEATASPDDSESVRDAKGWLSDKMPRGQSYRETIHQAAFAATFDMDTARAASSFDKLWRDVESLFE